MGVHGLWPLLDKAAQPLTNYSSLQNKRLAIDASIWIYQLQRGHADTGMDIATRFFFKRLVKLKHFGVRPLFVFDGLPPILKREELRRRTMGREKSKDNVKKLAREILKTRLKMLASGVEPPVQQKKQKVERPDLFTLKPIEAMDGEEESEDDLFSDFSDSDEDRDKLLASIDIDSSAFHALSEELRLEILLQLKERLYQERSSLKDDLDPTQFVLSQLTALKKRQKIAHALDNINRGANSGQLKPQKIASSEKKAFVLVKDKSHGYTFQSSHSVDEQTLVVEKEVPGHSEDEFMSQLFGETKVEEDKVLVDAKQKDTTPEERLAIVSEEPLPEPKTEIAPKTVASFDEQLDLELPVESIATKVARETTSDSRSDDKSLQVVHPTDVEEFVDKVSEWIAHRENGSDHNLAALHEELNLLQQRHAKNLAASEHRSSDLEKHFRGIIDAFGFPWMVAVGEAEAQCAHLYMTGVVDGIITDDVDTFLFGGNDVYRWFFKSNVAPIVYSLKADDLLFTRENLIFLALLIGGDYGPGVAGIGPKKAMALLQQNQTKTLQDKLASCCGDSLLNARIVDAYLNPAVESIPLPMYKSVDLNLLRSYLQQSGFKEHEITRQLDDINKQALI